MKEEHTRRECENCGDKIDDVSELKMGIHRDGTAMMSWLEIKCSPGKLAL